MNVADLMGSATLRIERVTRAIRREPLDKLDSAGIPAISVGSGKNTQP